MLFQPRLYVLVFVTYNWYRHWLVSLKGGVQTTEMLRMTFPRSKNGPFKGKHGRLTGTLILVLAILVLVDSRAFGAATYPEPKGNINDYVGVLTLSDIANLNALVNAVFEQTGATFAVAIVPDHGDESIEIYGVKALREVGYRPGR